MILILMLLLILIVWMLWPHKQKTLKEIAIESAKIMAIIGGFAVLTYTVHAAPVFAFTDVLYSLYFKATLIMIFFGIVRISLMLLAFASCASKTRKQQE